MLIISQIPFWGSFFLIGVRNEIVYEFSQGLMEKLAVEAFEVAMVSFYIALRCENILQNQ